MASLQQGIEKLRAPTTQSCTAGVLGTSGFEVQSLLFPALQPEFARVRVHCLGLCRTDLLVAAGELPVPRPMIPGHEFSGVLVDVHPESVHQSSVDVGQSVTVNPWLPCRNCEFCFSGHDLDCQASRFLGVDLWGACAQYVDVPIRSLHAFDEARLSFQEALFAEPVAASLAVVQTSISPEHRGFILGENRIATLTSRVLSALGFASAKCIPRTELLELPDHQFDFVIETEANSECMPVILGKLRPGGTLVIKSRCFQPVELVPAHLLAKRVKIEFAHYGDFSTAVDLLQSRRVLVADLIGQVFPLQDCPGAFQHAGKDESKKTLIEMGS